MFKYLAAVALIAAPSIANAQAIIDNGTVRLGVGNFGQLGAAASTGECFGVYDLRNKVDGTRAGCEREGWGVAVNGTGTTGYANNSQGSTGLTLASFTSTANSATSSVRIDSSALTVVHEFIASTVADLYKVNVTITNTGSAATAGNILYRRVTGMSSPPNLTSIRRFRAPSAQPTSCTPATTLRLGQPALDR